MKRDKIKISSNKSFGIVFFIVFLIFSIYPIINDNTTIDTTINELVKGTCE